MRKKVIFMGRGVLICFLAIGCNREDGKMKIGVSLLTQSQPFYQSLRKTLEEEAAQQGVNLFLTIADQDLNRQLLAIEEFIEEGVDLIILTPIDSDGVKGEILKAKLVGIPIITIDVIANDVKATTHIVTDNYTGGRIAGEAMAQYLDYKGEIALISYPEVQPLRDRIDGFKDQIVQYEELEVVIELPGRTQEEAKKALEDIIAIYPAIDGISGFEDDIAIAAAIALEQRSSRVTFIGFDGLEEMRDTVDKDNVFKAVVTQDPNRMGRTAIKLAEQLLKGNEVPHYVPILPGLYAYQKKEVPVNFQGSKLSLNLQ